MNGGTTVCFGIDDAARLSDEARVRFLCEVCWYVSRQTGRTWNIHLTMPYAATIYYGGFRFRITVREDMTIQVGFEGRDFEVEWPSTRTSDPDQWIMRLHQDLPTQVGNTILGMLYDGIVDQLKKERAAL